jgi:hypothetical protein
MNKPILPAAIESKFPAEITRLIYKFIPKYSRKQPASPSYERILFSFQKSPKRTAMDLYGLDDFVLN